MKHLASILCGLLLFVPVSYANDRGVTAAAYKQELLDTIKQCDRIEVVEHSHFTDDNSGKYGRSVGEMEARVPYYEYGRADLNAQAKAAFLKSASDLGTVQTEGGWRCIYQPHHTIRFYQRGELYSTMEICFTCSQVAWYGDYYAYPVGMMDVLRAAVSSCRFKPEKDEIFWRERYEAARKKHPDALPKPRPPREAEADSADKPK